MKNKNWHCHHCTGYCICTRCLRQDIITQLKAYLISLGGNLNILRDQSKSVFDSQILKNYNEHLELTLGQNQWLYTKYPYFLKMLKGKSFKDPTQIGDQSSKTTPSFAQSGSKKSAAVFNTEENAQSNLLTNLGFISGSNHDQLANNIHCKKTYRNESIFSNTNKQANEKLALSLLFRYSLLNKKMDDQNNMVCLQNRANFGSSTGDLGQKISDKRYLEQIIRSIKSHDSEVTNRIQKRRGRKKFILSNSSEDQASQDTMYTNCLNKRDQKYLNKISQMAETSNHSVYRSDYSKFNSSLINGELREFQEDWPKSSTKSLQQIERMLNQFGLNKRVLGNSDYASNLSEISKLMPWKSKMQKSVMGQKNAKYSLNAPKKAIISNDKNSFIKKRGQTSRQKPNKGKVLRLRPQVSSQSKKFAKK